MAIRWCLDQPGVTVALCGARRPDQLEDNIGGAGWSFSETDQQGINRIVTETIGTPVGPEFMSPL
jgi:aryl-alcohol dehydrogenase-like predicted oxidoreductase